MRSRASGCPAGRATTAATSSTRSPTGPSSSAPRAWCGSRSATAARSTSPVAKFLVRRRAGGAGRRASAREPGDLLLIVADEWMHGVRGPRPAPQRPRPAAGARGPVPLRVGASTSRCSSASTTTGHPKPAHHPFTRPHPDDIDRLESDPMSVRQPGLRPRAQRLGAGLGLASGSTSPSCSSASSTCSASARRRPTGGSASSYAVPLRRAAARRVRLRHRPARRHPRRRGEHPRGHRLPEAPVGHRPHDRRADAGRRQRSSPTWASALPKTT